MKFGRSVEPLERIGSFVCRRWIVESRGAIVDSPFGEKRSAREILKSGNF